MKSGTIGEGLTAEEEEKHEKGRTQGEGKYGRGDRGEEEPKVWGEPGVGGPAERRG